MNKTNNTYIITWKGTVEIIIAGIKMLSPETDTKEWLQNYAKNQIKDIEQKRPNKVLTALEQANPEQKELLQYLAKVAETGEL